MAENSSESEAALLFPSHTQTATLWQTALVAVLSYFFQDETAVFKTCFWEPSQRNQRKTFIDNTELLHAN